MAKKLKILIFPDPRLRKVAKKVIKFDKSLENLADDMLKTMYEANGIGLAATQAAFTECDDWHQAQLAYLKENRDRVFEAVNSIEGLSMIKPDATFLAWVDASGLKVDNVLTWAEQKGVGPSPGADFHQADHFRINYGCSKQMLEDILARLCQ